MARMRTNRQFCIKYIDFRQPLYDSLVTETTNGFLGFDRSHKRFSFPLYLVQSKRDSAAGAVDRRTNMFTDNILVILY